MIRNEIPRQLGDYQLDECLSQAGNRFVYSAIQVGIQRRVVVELLALASPSEEDIDHFREDARVKARVSLPQVGQVYEVAEDKGVHFLARQELVGETLAKLIESKKKLAPSDVARILRELAEVMNYYKSIGVAHNPVGLRHLYFSGDGHFSVKNLTRIGDPDEELAQAEIQEIGAAMVGLVAEGAPASGRVLTLLHWMQQGKVDGEVFHWREVGNVAEQIISQLQDASFSEKQKSRRLGEKSSLIERMKPYRSVLVGAGIGLVILAAAVALIIANKPERPSRGVYFPPPPVVVAADNEAGLADFEMDARPVSVGEYQEFLVSWADADEESRARWRHPDQPGSKEGHEPLNWSEVYAEALASGVKRDGDGFSLASAIVGVDFFDAWAFAQWRNRSLPTIAQWQMVCNQLKDLEQQGFELEPLIDEWTSSVNAKPNIPMERFPVILERISKTGLEEGEPSRRLPQKVEDSFREKRPELGFRTCAPRIDMN